VDVSATMDDITNALLVVVVNYVKTVRIQHTRRERGQN